METDNVDKKYSDMMRAKRRFKKMLATNRYHLTCPPCCMTCKFSYFELEEGYFCALFKSEWMINEVSEKGLCDKYEIKSS